MANTTLLALTLAFINFKERYTQTRTRVETMEYLAYTDLLTELPNRRWLEDELQRSLALASRQGSKLAVLFVDLDRFKLVNDTLGHESGDLLEQQVAARLRACMRESDILARISGDEFILIARGLQDSHGAVNVAQKTQDVLAAPFTVQGQTVEVTASIGMSLYPDDGHDAPALLRHADSAMYHVKHLGRNAFQSFNAEVAQGVEERSELERALQGALQRDEFILHYQPQYDLGSGTLVKVEALLRWHHPRFGLVAPNRFIPLAEANGLITSIGAWVLKESCRQNAAWQRAGHGHFKIAVNVSPLQFVQPNFFEVVTQVLAESELEPCWLELELTEGIVMQNLKLVTEVLGRLKSLRVGLAIDDFGTGYSSLAYLRSLPIDTVKIDRSFVNDLGAPREAPQYALALIQAIVSLAENLELTVTAEGIETQAQLGLLRDLGCHVGQGYLFAKPAPAAELQTRLGPSAEVHKQPQRVPLASR